MADQIAFFDVFNKMKFTERKMAIESIKNYNNLKTLKNLRVSEHIINLGCVFPDCKFEIYCSMSFWRFYSSYSFFYLQSV